MVTPVTDIVPDSPLPPIVITTTTNSILLSWFAPNNTGGLTITRYELYVTNVTNIWKLAYNGTLLSYNVTSLSTGIYKFQLIACNSLGCSGYSALTIASTSTPEIPPTIN